MIALLLAAALQSAPPANRPPIIIGPEPTPARSETVTREAATVLAPSTPWASFDEGYRCTVERTFGPAPGTLAFKFGLTAFPTGPGGASLIFRGLTQPRKVKEVTLGFDKGLTPVSYGVRLVETKRNDILLLHVYATEGIFWASFREATRMTISFDGVPVATLSITGSAAATRAAEACARKQFIAFGGSPAQADDNLSVSMREGGINWFRPRGSDASWINAGDYPDAARDLGITGRSVIAFTIDTDGRPRDCRTIGSSRNLALDVAGCTALVKRARYHPVRGPDGTPIAVIGAMRIDWQLPSDYILLGDPFVGGFIGAGQGGGIVN